MISQNPISRIIWLCFGAGLFLISCGGKSGKSNKIEVKAIPEKPIVITGDTVANGKDCSAPWFAYDVRIKNGADAKLRIVAIQAEVTGTSEGGTPTTTTVTWSPSDFDGNHLGIDSPTCTYETFGTWDPDQDKEIELTGAYSLCPTGITDLFVCDNPTGPQGKSFRYRVKLKPLGYFLDEDDIPSDRFEKFKMFFTQ